MAPSWSSFTGRRAPEPGYAWWGKGKGAGRSTQPAQEPYGHSTSKIPPYWEPGLELRGYPFRIWLQDVDVWSAGTELQPELQAPAVAQRLGGAARALVREVPTNELRDGRLDPLTGALETGLVLLTRGLSRRFGAFAVETSTRCIIDMLTFRRLSTENVDEALSRFETLRAQARAQAVGFELPLPVTCWLLLEAMHIPRRTWPLVLAPWQNRMPEDEPGLRSLCESIRHQGHIAESPHAGSYSWRGASHGKGFFAGDSLEDDWAYGSFGLETCPAEESGDPEDWGPHYQGTQPHSVFYDESG